MQPYEIPNTCKKRWLKIGGIRTYPYKLYYLSMTLPVEDCRSKIHSKSRDCDTEAAGNFKNGVVVNSKITDLYEQL